MTYQTTKLTTNSSEYSKVTQTTSSDFKMMIKLLISIEIRDFMRKTATCHFCKSITLKEMTEFIN